MGKLGKKVLVLAATALLSASALSAKKIEYMVAFGATIPTLEMSVNGFIAEGWKPLGGVAVDTSSGMPYLQAMTRESWK